MNIRKYMYRECLGYCKLTDDLEEFLGWDDDAFNDAFHSFLSVFDGESDPLSCFFIESEDFELDLKDRLYSAFYKISKNVLIEWSKS